MQAVHLPHKTLIRSLWCDPVPSSACQGDGKQASSSGASGAGQGFCSQWGGEPKRASGRNWSVSGGLARPRCYDGVLRVGEPLWLRDPLWGQGTWESILGFLSPVIHYRQVTRCVHFPGDDEGSFSQISKQFLNHTMLRALMWLALGFGENT